jgi:phosphatidylserine/phosphatidylglycerophosphate/cardiolipin synthase-like enzyme
MRSFFAAFVAVFICCTAEPSFGESKRVDCSAPVGSCPAEIVFAIKSAQSGTDVLMQAFYLTDEQIVDALIDAKGRGVTVRIVVAKIMQERTKVSMLEKLVTSGIEVRTNDPKPINNKVTALVITGEVVIEGTFSFAPQTEDFRAGSLLVSHDIPALSKRDTNPSFVSPVQPAGRPTLFASDRNSVPRSLRLDMRSVSIFPDPSRLQSGEAVSRSAPR